MVIAYIDYDSLKTKVMKYSLKITRNVWDADDLTQDVMLKLFVAFEKDSQKHVTNAFLYRVAVNTWKDKLRKKNWMSHSDVHYDYAGVIANELSTRELIEEASVILPPRSVIILLLVDVFDFTAKEAAALLAATEGAVQVAIGRIRSTLRSYAAASNSADTLVCKTNIKPSIIVEIDALVDAFKRRDMQAICNAYFGLTGQGTKVDRLKLEGNVLHFTLIDPDGNRYRISSNIFT